MRKCKAVKPAVRLGSGSCSRLFFFFFGHYYKCIAYYKVFTVYEIGYWCVPENTSIYFFFIFPYDGVVFPFDVIIL
jgi:hypothetical protein